MARLEAPSNTRSILVSAEESIRAELGFSEFKRIEVDGEESLLAQVRGRPVILVYSPVADHGISAAIEELAIQMGATVPDGPADYVWVTLTGKLGEGFTYSWLPGQECPVSSLPSRENWQKDVSPSPQRRPA
jgi:hypothetical protein